MQLTCELLQCFQSRNAEQKNNKDIKINTDWQHYEIMQ